MLCAFYHGRRPRGGGGGDGPVPANFSAFNIMPMDGTWKESTSNGPHPPPPNRRAVAPPLASTSSNVGSGQTIYREIHIVFIQFIFDFYASDSFKLKVFIQFTELAGQGFGVLREITRVPKHSWMSLMVSCAVYGVDPILLEPLDGKSVRAPSLHYRYEPPEKSGRYRSPVTVWVRPCPSSDQKGPIMPELLTAHQAVHFRLCRGLSLIMSGAVVAQNRLFWALTLPSSSKLPLSKFL